MASSETTRWVHSIISTTMREYGKKLKTIQQDIDCDFKRRGVEGSGIHIQKLCDASTDLLETTYLSIIKKIEDRSSGMNFSLLWQTVSTALTKEKILSEHRSQASSLKEILGRRGHLSPSVSHIIDVAFSFKCNETIACIQQEIESQLLKQKLSEKEPHMENSKHGNNSIVNYGTMTNCQQQSNSCESSQSNVPSPEKKTHSWLNYLPFEKSIVDFFRTCFNYPMNP